MLAVASFVVAFAPGPLDAQPTLRGRVTAHTSGEPLSGARVIVEGAGVGDTTGTDGAYSLRLPVERQSFVVRVVKLGYRPVTRTVAARAAAITENFELRVQPLGLDAVVVTGTAGPTAVREVGHSSAQIKVASIPEPIASVDNLLAGKLPGVAVIPSTGLAGSGSKIRLRGSASVSLSNQPLVYVDGVRIRSDGYPKNAPFLIGENSRGPNDTPSPLNDIDPADIERVEIVRGPAAATLYGTEAAAGVIQIFTRRGAPGKTVWRSQVDAGVSRVRPFGTGDYPYMRLDPWLRDATRMGYSVSAGGGGTDAQYQVSSSYYRSEGVLPNDLERRLTLRGNFDFRPHPKLSLAWSSAFTANRITNTPAGPNGQGLTQNAYRGPANATGIDTKESLDRILVWDITSEINHVIGGATATFTPTRSTSHTVTVGFDRADDEMRSLRPFGYVFTPQGALSTERWQSMTSTLDYLGRTRIGLGRSLAATLAWGGQSIETEVTSVAGYAEGFAGPAPPTLTSGALTRSGESRVRAIIAGAFGQATLAHRDRLFLTAGLRIDGSSSFGSDFGLQPFPRLGASYVISDETFWPRAAGTMRLRAAYGEAGRAPRVFDADRTWTQAGFDGRPAFVPVSVGNPKLGPERSAETELGFDATALAERLRAEVTWYRRTMRDALLPVGQPPSLGFLAPQLTNVGTIRISGLEVALKTELHAPRGVTLDAGMDLSLNRTKAVDLGGNPPFVLSEVAWIRQGHAAPVVIGLRIRNPDEVAAPDLEQNHVYGPNMPTRTVGGSVALRFTNGAELSARAEYQGGHFMYDNASRSLYSQGVHPLCENGYSLIRESRLEELTAWERVYCRVASVPADGAIVRGDFARLRDLSLTFPIPGALMRSRNASITFATHHFLLWKNSTLDVFDPEMSGRDGMFAPVRTIEFGVPVPTSFSISVRATH